MASDRQSAPAGCSRPGGRAPARGPSARSMGRLYREYAWSRAARDGLRSQSRRGSPPPAPAGLARWAGVIESILSVARAHTARLTLGLDLTEGIGRALGLELAPFAPDCWEGLLQGAASLAPLSDSARTALLAWLGESVANVNWPTPLRARAGRIVRRLNHLKFGIDGAGSPSLKAYLYFGPYRLSQAQEPGQPCRIEIQVGWPSIRRVG